MKRKLIFTLSVLLTAAAFNPPVTQSIPPPPIPYCEMCRQSCWNEANGEPYQQCRWEQGKSQSECDVVVKQYYNNCLTVDCNQSGCTIPLLD